MPQEFRRQNANGFSNAQLFFVRYKPLLFRAYDYSTDPTLDRPGAISGPDGLGSSLRRSSQTV